jgi:hypothetical protein
MADLQSLPADQRAAVQLLLAQGQTYEQIADLLGIDAAGVRQRAHDAVDALAGGAGPRPDQGRRAQISDYLLGQQSVAEREITRDYLADDPTARGWARSAVDELRPAAPDALPDIPEGRPGLDEDEAPYAAFPDDEPRSSRLGGALLLGGVAVVVAVIVVLLLSGGDDDGPSTSTLSTRPSTQTATTPQSQTRPVAQINLLPPGGGSRPVGLAQVFQRGQDRAIVMAAQGVSPGTYALWLYNSRGDARFLGFVPQRIGRDGRFATQGVLPRDANRYRQLVVTRETVSSGQRRPPRSPGRIVLQGRLELGAPGG